MIAVELVGAIFIADFPKYEKVILADVILAAYGPSKRKAARVDHVSIANLIGVDPRMIRRALNRLLKRGVLVDNRDGTYSFAKDWESWIDESSDAPMIGAGERRFVAYALAQYSTQNASSHKRKEGTKACRSDASDRQKTGTKQSPKHLSEGTIESPETRNTGTPWSPPDAYESCRDDGASAGEPSTSDRALACVPAPASEDKNIRDKKKECGVSTPPTLRGGAGGLHDQLDQLRDEVAKLTDDDGLADVFREQVTDWMTGGMLVEDVRQAILIARGKSVLPMNFVPFVSSASRRVKNERLEAERRVAPPHAPPGEPTPVLIPMSNTEAKRKRLLDGFAAMKERDRKESD